MKRYSIAPSSARRKSTNAIVDEPISSDRENATVELQQLEQAITSTLQDIDKNLSKSNAVLNDKIFPIIRQYSKSTESVWKNVNYWKYFFELSANAELTSYQSPVSKSINQNNLLLLDEEFYKRNNATATNQQTLDPMERFKKPFAKNIEEQTPTWSTEQPNKKFISSTPQESSKRLGKFDESESINLKPPPMLTSNVNLEHKSPTHHESVVYTVRKSLDQYHRLSISPRKTKRPKTPQNDDFHRRSSIIKGLRDSSPTLPEPPVLVSEIGPNSESLDNKASEEDLQRFPRTPQFKSGVLSSARNSEPRTSERLSLIKTPQEIQNEFHEEDSDLQPPSITGAQDDEPNKPDKEIEDVPLPELETIELRKKLEEANKKKRRLEDKDEDSPFIEEKQTNPDQANLANPTQTNLTEHTHNSITSTVYHSLMTHQKENNSRDNTKSNSISNLFEDVLQDIGKEHPEFNEDTKRSDGDSSREMGSALHERFNQILRR